MPLSLTRQETSGTDPENVFLLYARKSHVTGKNLGRFLGVPHGRRCRERRDHIIRWGSSRDVSHSPREGYVNGRQAIRRAVDKLGSLRTMRDAGVQVPPFSRNWRDLEYPMLGRSRRHTRGQDINLVLQKRDVDLTDNDYFVQYVPTKLEYRMHVMDDNVFKVHEKRLRHDAENHPYIRNAEHGWVFVEPRRREPSHELATSALDALGLDFGAVDVVRGEDDEEYVLEVNTAPSLDEANLQRYGDVLAEKAGLQNYPGMDAEFDFGDEEEDE